MDQNTKKYIEKYLMPELFSNINLYEMFIWFYPSTAKRRFNVWLYVEYNVDTSSIFYDNDDPEHIFDIEKHKDIIIDCKYDYIDVIN
jgi:hypothetical protein